jgi:outer membrane protein TolC
MNAIMLRSRGHLARKEFSATRHLLESVLGEYPEALAPRVLLTRALLAERKDWAAAEQQLREVLARHPDHAEARHNLAVLHGLRRREEQRGSSCSPLERQGTG